MSRRVKLKKYFLERNKRVLELIRKPAAAYRVSDFHDLRVEIKKIKALAGLLDETGTFTKDTFLKSYRTVFGKAGKIRELQLQEKIIKKTRSPYGLKKYLQELRKERERKKKDFFVTKYRHAQHIAETRRRIMPALDKVDAKKVNKYISKERARIKKLMRKSELKPKQAHSLRKKMKTFFYNRKSLDLAKKKDLKKCETLQELMGRWHDYEVAGEYIKKKIGKKTRSTGQPAGFVELDKQFDKERRSLFKKIGKSIKRRKFLKAL